MIWTAVYEWSAIGKRTLKCRILIVPQFQIRTSTCCSNVCPCADSGATHHASFVGPKLALITWVEFFSSYMHSGLHNPGLPMRRLMSTMPSLVNRRWRYLYRFSRLVPTEYHSRMSALGLLIPG
jgi:hypothetical protein